MQITLNKKTYDTDTMSPEAQAVVSNIVNAATQELAYKASKEFFTQQLTAILETNQPVDTEETTEES